MHGFIGARLKGHSQISVVFKSTKENAFVNKDKRPCEVNTVLTLRAENQSMGLLGLILFMQMLLLCILYKRNTLALGHCEHAENSFISYVKNCKTSNFSDGDKTCRACHSIIFFSHTETQSVSVTVGGARGIVGNVVWWLTDNWVGQVCMNQGICCMKLKVLNKTFL